MTTLSPENRALDLEAALSVPPFAEGGVGDLMSRAAEAYLEDYVMGTDEGADHDPTEFERDLLTDFFNGLMSEEGFFGPVRALIEMAARQEGAPAGEAGTELARIAAEQATYEAWSDIADSLVEARDLLMERRYGNPARSPAHNARLVLDTILAKLSTPSARRAEPVALAHIRETDTYLDIEMEVLDGAGLQPHHSPVKLYLEPARQEGAGADDGGYDEGELAEALERSWRDVVTGVLPHVAIFNMVGRHMVHHLKDVRREFAAQALATHRSGEG